MTAAFSLIAPAMEAASLLRLTTALDGGTPEQTPEKLEQLWNALTGCTPGTSHATEKVIVRWLLKTMNGPSAAAETVRRYSLTWAIMACVFARTPLFSLAKALADRRFVAVLQQTAKDLSTPTGPAASATSRQGSPPRPRGDSLKRKRSPRAPFDLESLRCPSGCLESAQSLFAALDVLLSRLALGDAAGHPANERAGAEHIKALFRAPAAEAITVLSPLLAVCHLAIKNPAVDALQGQQSWVRTAAGLWELHLQRSSDAVDFALHLSRACCLMLAELPGVSESPSHSALDREVATAWARDLKRLVTRNFTLPARSEFFNQKSTEIISTPIRLGNLHATILCPVLLLLVLEAPRAIGGNTTNRDNNAWVEAVFDLVEAPLRSLPAADRNVAMKRLLGMTMAYGCNPTLASLRSICRHYAIGPEHVDWALVSALAECDADIFLASEEGRNLLAEIMERAPHSPMPDGTDRDSLCSMLLSLANASVRAREFTRFVKQWFDNLVECFAAAPSRNESSARVFWSDAKVTTSISTLIQQALTTKQLVGLVEELARQATSPPAQAARAIVFDTICQGINAEDFIEAAGLLLFEAIWVEPLPFSLGDASAAQWRIASKGFTWGLTTPADGFGPRVIASVLTHLSQTDDCTSDMANFDAFRCAAAVWSSCYVGDGSAGGQGSIVSSFLTKLSAELRRDGLVYNDPLLRLWLEPAEAVTNPDPFGPFQLWDLSATTFAAWILLWFPRLISVASTTDASGFVPAVLQSICGIDMTAGQDAQACHHAFSVGLVNSLSSLQSEKSSLRGLVDPIINVLSGAATQKSAALGFVVKIPSECLSRTDRERIVSVLYVSLIEQSLAAEDGVSEEAGLGVMVQMMRTKPTLCPELSFRGLLELGTNLASRCSRRDKSAVGATRRDAAVVFRLFEELACLTVGQMTASPGAREAAYVREIWPVLSEHVPKRRHGGRLVLLTLISVFVSTMKKPAVSKHFSQEITRVEEATEELGRLVVDIITRFFKSTEEKTRKPADHKARSLLELQMALLAANAHWNPEMEASIVPLQVRMAAECPALGLVDPELAFLLTTLLDYRLGLPPTAESESPNNTDMTLDRVTRLVTEDGDIAKAALLRSVSVQLHHSPNRSAQFLTARRALRQLKASSPDTAADLTVAQSALTQLLVKPESPADFVDAARIAHSLLDGNAASTTQWNVDHTLSSISLLCSSGNTGNDMVRQSAQTYEWLCRLTEAILKRHRRRLEGHLHVLVATLQALLSCLLRHPYDSERQCWAPGVLAGGRGKHPFWERHARLYARLLTLVCEPSVASVVRSQQSALDSATDAAKRLAGQYMYLVVMDFIKLQLEGHVPHGVREALLPGVYSILDVTPPDLRRVMADAMDSSGRAIWKDLYDKYRKFGKWRGT